MSDIGEFVGGAIGAVFMLALWLFLALAPLAVGIWILQAIGCV